MRTGYVRLTGKAITTTASGNAFFNGEIMPFKEDRDIDEAHEGGHLDQRAYYGGEGCRCPILLTRVLREGSANPGSSVAPGR
ncbi:MAG: hypothetical protein A2052_07410 [Deltaproteobacteria bacterium GWA2_54_12]|nr:MAG: hypothetical protein A2052_07410 [Deltaproteobacteria bacterium GWA2_54_12]